MTDVRPVRLTGRHALRVRAAPIALAARKARPTR